MRDDVETWPPEDVANREPRFKCPNGHMSTVPYRCSECKTDMAGKT